MTRERLCEWETRRLGDWEDWMTRRQEEFGVRQEDWRQEDWKIARQEEKR